MNPNQLKRNIPNSSLTASIVGMLFVLVSAALADEIKPEEKKGWESVAAAGLTLTRGNSENIMVNASINSARKWTEDELLLGASGGYGKTTDRKTDVETKTDDYLKGFAQWNHLFTERIYAG